MNMTVNLHKKPDFTYEAYRQEVADIYFNGDASFKVLQIKSVGLHRGGSEGEGTWEDGIYGGDGGGGDSGGGE